MIFKPDYPISALKLRYLNIKALNPEISVAELKIIAAQIKKIRKKTNNN